MDENLQNDLIDTNSSSTTPSKLRFENLHLDRIPIHRENQNNQHPSESPFTKFCRGLQLTPAMRDISRFNAKGNMQTGQYYLSKIISLCL